MNEVLYSIAGVLIPFIGTSLGSTFVFFLKKNINDNFQKIMIGFASGVMIAASVWSLILPSVEMSKDKYNMPWIPAAIRFIAWNIFFDIC